MVYPQNFEQKIDFGNIRQLLKEKSISTLGKEKIDSIHFSSDFYKIIQQLDQTNEMLQILTTETNELPLSNIYDIRPSLHKIHVEGLYLTENELYCLRTNLENAQLLTTYFSKLNSTFYPQLSRLSKTVKSFSFLIDQINKILTKYGDIKDNASPQLEKIRKNILTTQNNISRTLNEILQRAFSNGYVEKDTLPTLREGRLVIPVSQAFKRKINGIVHDESASGKTVYIEPAEVIELNNSIRELEGEERREIIRILTDITNYIRPFIPDLLELQNFLGEIDFLHSKALFAIDIKAIRPNVENKCIIQWNKASHPLLYLSLQKQGKNIVPLDIVLNENQRILIISGPNAGGKSVCLKTVGLLQYMLQCGLLIPLDESSQIGIFENLFIDIGDEQSIENDLSTYSSHLLNMKFFIQHSNEKTLVMIDEFGSGTEPQIGGAIAEAVLERINQQKAFGVITTHYTNLKHFAENTEGVVNGAMLFDRGRLQPLFQLQIGFPGSSFAIEIARKIGLPDDIIEEAAQKVGKEHFDYEKHLHEIIRDKRYWENKRKKIRQREKYLEKIIEQYETTLNNIEKKQKEIIQATKAEAIQLLNEANAKIENTIRQIKEAQAEKEKTKEIRKELETFKKEKLEPEILPKPIEPSIQLKRKKSKKVASENLSKSTFQVGNYVKIKGHSLVGRIIEISEEQAIIAFGQMKSTIELSKLEFINRTQTKKEINKIQQSIELKNEEIKNRKLNFKTEIDVRGMRGEEAVQVVSYFIDDAIMVGANSVRILHGTGSGILRQLIRQYLATVPQIKNFHDEHVEFGGSGITIVEFV